MKSVLGARITNMFNEAFGANSANLVTLSRSLLPPRDDLRMCDLGCGDGALTTWISTELKIRAVDVVETFDPHIEKAKQQGFSVIEADLNGALPIESEQYDLVVANQVIEHLYDTDAFVSEAVRIAKPGGAIVISTENAASWHNIGALLVGWQAFSLTNVSDKAAGIGNPLALHAGESGNPFPMQHHRLFTVRALKELLHLHGVTDLKASGAGYYPLPASFGRVDPTHSHFITVGGKKRSV